MVLVPALLCLAAATADSSRPDSAFQRFGGVPVLAYTGETGWQLGALGMLFLRPVGPDDPGSQVDVAAIWTTERQYRFVLNPTLAFREGAIRWESEYQFKHWPGKYWEGGNEPTDSALAYDMDLWWMNGSVLWLAGGRTRVGVEYDLERNDATFHEPDSADLAAHPDAYPRSVPENVGGDRVGLGWSLEWDGRDHDNWPRHGAYARFRQVRYDGIWGSDWNFTDNSLDLRGFVPTPLGGAGAFGVWWEGVWGEVPFDRLAIPDGTYRMRGMKKGRLSDRQQLVLQGEWRVPLFWRFGAAVFAEAGKVGEDAGALLEGEFRHVFGMGGRFTLNRSRRLNVRGDLSWVDDGIGMTVYYKEAF